MSSNKSTSSSSSQGSGGGSTHRPTNLSLAERIRLSREREERDRRRQAQEDLHRLQEQSSHTSAATGEAPSTSASTSSGQEYTMRLNDLSTSGGSTTDENNNTEQQAESGDTTDAASGDEARSLLEPEEYERDLLEPEGVLAPAKADSGRSSRSSSSLISEVDESESDEGESQQQQPSSQLRSPLAGAGAGAGGASVFSYAPSIVSGAMSAMTGTLSAMTGYTGGDEDNDSDSREDDMDESQAVASRAAPPSSVHGGEETLVALATAQNDGNDQADDDGNSSLTSYEKNVALHTAVQLGALTAEAGNDDMSEVASTYDVGSLSGFESAVPSVAGGRSTAALSTGAMSRRTMGTKSVSIGGLETIGEEDSQALLAAEEGLSRQNSGRRSSVSGSSGASPAGRRDSATTAVPPGGMAMAGPGLLDRVASAYSRSTMASDSSRSRWSSTDDEYTTAYTSASDDDYTSGHSYSTPSDSSRSFFTNPRFGFRSYQGASSRSFYTTSDSGESSGGESSRPSLLDAVGEKLSHSLRSLGTHRTESDSSTSNWGSNSDLLTGNQRIPSKTGKRIRQADMMVRRRWAIPASIILAVILFLAIYLGLQSRKSGSAKGLDFGDGGGRGGIYGDDDAVLFQGYTGDGGDVNVGGAFDLYPTPSPAEVVSQVPTSEVMIHTVPTLLDDENQLTEFGSDSGLLTTTTTTEVATGWGVPVGQPTPDPAMLPSLVQGTDGSWGWQSGMPTIKLDSSFLESIQSETKTTTTTTTSTAGGTDGGSTTDHDVKLKWNVPAGSPTPNPALLSQVSAAQESSTSTETTSSVSITGAEGDSTEKTSTSLTWNLPEGSPTPDPALLNLVGAAPVAAPVAAPTPAVQWGSEEGQPTPPPALLDVVTTNADGEVTWDIPVGSPTPDPALLDQVVAAPPVAEPTPAVQWATAEAGQPTPPPALLDVVTTNADGEVVWDVPVGSPTPPPYLLDQVVAATPETGADDGPSFAQGADTSTTTDTTTTQDTYERPVEIADFFDEEERPLSNEAQETEGPLPPDRPQPAQGLDFETTTDTDGPSFAQGGETTTSTSTATTDTEGPNFAQGGETSTDTEGPNFAQGGGISETTDGNDLPIEIFEPAPPAPQPATQPQEGPNFAQGAGPAPGPAPGPATGGAGGGGGGGPVVTTQQVSPGTGGYPQYAPNAPAGTGGYPQYAPNAPVAPGGYPQYAPNYGGYGMYPGGYPQMPMGYPQFAPMAPSQPAATTTSVATSTPVAVGGGGTPVVMHHNMEFIGDCLKDTCIADENEENFKGHSHEDNAIYEIFYTNPVKCCGVVMEVGAGDGLDGSVSHFFEEGLNWKSILVEADPKKFVELKKNRPDATAINAGFCESGSIKYDGNFHPEDPDEIISEAVSTEPFSEDASEDVMCLSMSPLIRQNLKVTHIDVMVIHVDGDPLAVIRKMDWTVRVDIWIIVMDKKTPEMEERNKVVKSVLDRNEYVEAEWDIKRWCDESAKGQCENNTVFLRKNFNPLYLQRSLKGRKQLRGNSK